MPTPHISAAAGEIAPLVLMPGDPRRAARIAEEDEMAVEPQECQALVLSRPAHRVENHVDRRLPANRRDPGSEVDPVRDGNPTHLANQVKLFRGRCRSENLNPATAEHLNQQEPDASGRRMNKRTLTLCHRRREVSETEGGEPLNRKGRRDFQREPLGNPKQGVRRSHSVFGISPRAFERPERDPGAEPRRIHTAPQSLNNAGALVPGNPREFGQPVEPAPAFGVGEVDSGELQPDEDLPPVGRRPCGLADLKDARVPKALCLDRAHEWGD